MWKEYNGIMVVYKSSIQCIADSSYQSFIVDHGFFMGVRAQCQSCICTRYVYTDLNGKDVRSNIMDLVLMQRGLRLNPTDELLWHEYFRLELLYVEKIKLRRRVLGVDDESLEKQNNGKEEDKMDVDWKDDAIKLPTITGEEAEDWKNASDERKTVKKMEESAAEALKEGNNPILQGILATIVYDNAIQGELFAMHDCCVTLVTKRSYISNSQ